MKFLKKIWNAANGNKTTIGMLLILASTGMKAFFPNAIPEAQVEWIGGVGGVLIGGIGVGHKAVKEYQKRVAAKIEAAKTNSNIN